jgi:hypothetical protein
LCFEVLNSKHDLSSLPFVLQFRFVLTDGGVTLLHAEFVSATADNKNDGSSGGGGIAEQDATHRAALVSNAAFKR